MKATEDIWSHDPPQDTMWYWRRMNALKGMMSPWYDRSVYRLTNNGHSVSSSYIALLGNMTVMREANLIWSCIMLPRQRIISWLAYQNKLLTKERLQRMHIQVENTVCCLYDEGMDETSQHLFTECKWITEARTALATWVGVTVPQKTFKQSLQWIKSRNWRQFKKEVVAAICGALVYYTWQARNWKIFRQTTVNNGGIVTQIQRELRERVSMISSARKVSKCPCLIHRICN